MRATKSDRDFAAAFIAEISDGWGEETEAKDVAELARQVALHVAARVEAEREACATICEHGIAWHPEPPAATKTYIRETCINLAKAIRRRTVA